MRSFELPGRIRASLIHAGLSLLLCAGVAICIFNFWYPVYYSELSGGWTLYLILVSVDMVLGPSITFFVYSRGKSLHLLRRDLIIVVVIQMIALIYGVWIVAMARPIHIVFELDRFRVVHAVDVDPDSVIPQGIDGFPWRGPTLVGFRNFQDSQEKMEATMAALTGVQLAFQPKFWQPYKLSVCDVILAAKPVTDLSKRFPQSSMKIEKLLRASGHSADTTLYLPLIGRDSDWTVFLDSTTAAVIGAFPLDSFEP